METQTVTVVIDKKGNGRVDMNGFHGVGCGAVAARLAAIGRTASETNKPEFYEQGSNGNTIVQG